jgi:hypothetical protein
MTLTFAGYIGVHVACGIGMFIITGILLGLCEKYSHSIYRFLLIHMLGVELEYNTDPDSPSLTIKIDQIPVKYERTSCQVAFLWIVATATVTLALMVLYEGCILGNAGVYIGDDCPSDPMTCFASNYNGSDTGTFECVPGNKTVFPNGTDKAWCYGWIVKRQTVSSVINQIGICGGICGGILGVSGTLFAFMFRAGQGEKWGKILWVILFFLSFLLVPTMISVASVSHIAFSVLAYLVAVEISLLFLAVFIFKGEEFESEDTIPKPVPVQITPVSI